MSNIITLKGLAPRIQQPKLKEPPMDPDHAEDLDTEAIIWFMRQSAHVLRLRMSKEDFEFVRAQL
jgi:hypothetical protein